MYLKKLGAALAMCTIIVGVTAIPAFAHHPIVSGNIVCNEQTGNYDVTWTVANGNWEGRTMTLDQSNRSAVPLSSYAPDESKSYTESLPGTTTGTTTLTVRGDWNNGGPQNVVNSASLESGGTCQTPAQPAITVSKGCPQSAQVGEEITYTIRVTNSGDEDLVGVTVDDSILGSLSSSFADTLSVGTFEEQTFSYTVGATPDPLVNKVTASGSGASSEKLVQSEATCQTSVIQPEPERKHTICHATDSTTNPYAGKDETINPSKSGVLDGHLDHTGPVPTSQAHLEQLKADHIPWGDIIPPFDWDGQTFSLNWSEAGQAIFNNGCALPEPEPELPEIGIVKQADDASVNAGEDIGYTVTVSNTGNGTAEDVELTDELPGDPGLDWEIAGTAGGWDCEIVAGTLTCGGQGFDLAPGEDGSVHITSPTTAETCGTVKNEAEAEWNADQGQQGPALSLRTNTGRDDIESEVATIEVECTPEIQIVKGGPGLVHVDDTITYTFEVTNPGELELFDVMLSDPICDQGTIVAGADVDSSLGVGEVWHFTCTHLVTAGDPDPLPNTATISGDTSEGEGGQSVSDTDDHVVDIIHPGISIVKTVDEEVVPIGTTVTFTYVIVNTGDSTLYDISVDDDILGHVGDIAILEPGVPVTLTKDFVVGDQIVTNVGTAAGEDVLARSVSAEDTATVGPIAGENPPPPNNPPTPFTGSDAGRLGIITMVLFGIGVTVVASTRRRRPKGEAA